ncbi:MAG: PorT family protein [Bacteroidota bacterium]|nr:PorT family protein [Bacteroidota bacterium]
MNRHTTLKRILLVAAAWVGGIQVATAQYNPKYAIPMTRASVEMAKLILKGNSYLNDKIRDIPQVNWLIAFEELMRQNEEFTPGRDRVWNRVVDPLQEMTAMQSGPSDQSLTRVPMEKADKGKTAPAGYFNVGVGLEIVGKGAKDIFSGGVGAPSTTTIRLWYLEVPILAAYHLPLASGASLVFQAGPYLGYALGGHYKDDQGTQKITFGKQGDYTRGDFGIQVHAGYTLAASPFSFWAFTEIGMHNLAPGVAGVGDKTKILDGWPGGGLSALRAVWQTPLEYWIGKLELRLDQVRSTLF